MKATDGVYFRREDCARFWVRVLVDVIDLMVFGTVCAALAVPVMMILPPTRSTVNLILLTCVAVAFSYFVCLKVRSSGPWDIAWAGSRSLVWTADPPVIRR